MKTLAEDDAEPRLLMLVTDSDFIYIQKQETSQYSCILATWKYFFFDFFHWASFASSSVVFTAAHAVPAESQTLYKWRQTNNSTAKALSQPADICETW